MKKKILVICVAMLLVTTTSIHAKEPKEPFKPRISLGVNAIVEGGMELRLKMGGDLAPFAVIVRPGVSFDAQLSKHSGIETGIYYRQNVIRERYVSPTGNPNEQILSPESRDSRILVPIYYKFYSRILNFAAGADFSFNLTFADDDNFSKVDCDFVLRISKDFNLYKNHLYIEPLLQGSVGNTAWWGVGLGLKYRF